MALCENVRLFEITTSKKKLDGFIKLHRSIPRPKPGSGRAGKEGPFLTRITSRIPDNSSFGERGRGTNNKQKF